MPMTSAKCEMRNYSNSSAKKFLDAMITGISDVEVSVRIQCDAPGIAELAGRAAGPAQNFHRSILGVEDLNAAVAEFAHVLIPGSINAHVIRVTHFAAILTRLAITAQPFSVRPEDLHAMIARIGDIETVL